MSRNWRKVAYARWGKLYLLDAISFHRIAPVLRTQAGLQRFMFHPDERSMVACYGHKAVVCWRLPPEHEPRMRVHHLDPSCVAFHPKGDRFASGGRDQTAKLWDFANGRLLQQWQHPTRVLSLAFSRDGGVLYTGGDQLLHAWDVNTGHPHRLFARQPDSIYSIDTTPDGKYRSEERRGG